MRKLTFVYMSIAIMVVTLVAIGNVSASTPVSSIIASDTTWTLANSPYQFTGPVCVLSGASLNIEPGVTVDFDNYYLRVNGTLHAIGTTDQPIVLTTDKPVQNPMQQIQFTIASTSWSEQTNTGSILDHVFLNRVSIDIKGSSPKISNNVFDNPIWVSILSRGGSPKITDNTFQRVEYEGLSVDRSSLVANNLFNYTTGQATAIVAHENAYVTSNKIVGYYNGINVDGQATVSANIVTGCSNAGLVSGSGNINNNYVYGGHIGISIEASGNIQNNAFVNNDIGLEIKNNLWQCNFASNNIVGSKQYSVSMQASQDVSIPNNWWGTTDIQAINQTIRDFKIDFNLGRVNIVPPLQEANQQAPATSDIDLTTTQTPPPRSPEVTPEPVTQLPNNPYIAPTESPSPPLAINLPTQPLNQLFSTENIVILLVVGFGILWTAILVLTRRKPRKNQ